MNIIEELIGVLGIFLWMALLTLLLGLLLAALAVGGSKLFQSVKK